MAEKEYSIEIQHLFENIEKLVEEAELGRYEAIQRLNAIKNLANPIFDFSPSDYKRILDKKLPLPVKKGIKLYEMMKELTFLVQPIGKRKGTACAVRLIDFENITWEEFLELRGVFSFGFITEVYKHRAEPNFNGLDILNERQKELYEQIGVYFGNKKKPTLQSLAMNLLYTESDGKDFSDRSLYVYLDALKKYEKKRRKAAGFNVIYFTFHSVASFNNGGTIRESLERMDKTLLEITASSYKITSELGAKFSKDLIVPMDILAKFSKAFVPKFQMSQINEMLQSIIPNLSGIKAISNFKTITKKKDSK